MAEDVVIRVQKYFLCNPASNLPITMLLNVVHEVVSSDWCLRHGKGMLMDAWGGHFLSLPRLPVQQRYCVLHWLGLYGLWYVHETTCGVCSLYMQSYV